MNYYQLSVIKYAERLYIFFEFIIYNDEYAYVYVYFAYVFFAFFARIDDDDDGKKTLKVSFL
jgi:hypothetical protein